MESGLHLIKDRWWDADKHALFRPGLGEMWAALTNLAGIVIEIVGRKGQADYEIGDESRTQANRIPTKRGILKNLQSD